MPAEAGTCVAPVFPPLPSSSVFDGSSITARATPITLWLLRAIVHTGSCGAVDLMLQVQAGLLLAESIMLGAAIKLDERFRSSPALLF